MHTRFAFKSKLSNERMNAFWMVSTLSVWCSCHTHTDQSLSIMLPTNSINWLVSSHINRMYETSLETKTRDRPHTYDPVAHTRTPMHITASAAQDVATESADSNLDNAKQAARWIDCAIWRQSPRRTALRWDSVPHRAALKEPKFLGHTYIKPHIC